MYFINNIDELTNEKILKIIQLFRGNELTKLQKYKDYYDGNQEILTKYVEDYTKPCNKLVVNHCYDIVQNYCGYLTGVPISYTSDEEISDIMDILKYNDYHNEDNDYLEAALTYGVAYELNFLDEEAQQRFTLFDTREGIPIYSNDLLKNLLAFIRMYSANDLDDASKNYIDVYTDREIYHYETDMSFSGLKLLEVFPHYYGQVPITVFQLNKDQRSIFDQIISLQDAYNKLLSADVDDYESFVEAYLFLKGLTADADDLAQMKEDRILLLDEDSDAGYLTKPDNSASITALIDKIEEQIQKKAKSPDFTDESFGTASGVAIQYKLTGMENIASNIESNMRKALQNRLELLCAIQRLTATEFIWRDVEIVFTRNLPVNYLEQAQLINQLRGQVSDKTLLSQLPFVKDVDYELELIKEQDAFAPVYDFGNEGDEVE